MYGTPSTLSEEVGSVYEHCLLAIERGTTAGAHGLPLMGAGDWNDGMNRVGIEGRGESVWVGWFLYAVLESFAPLCEQRGDSDRAAGFRAEMKRLKGALEKEAWDGEWYLRAFYDNGEPMGSAESEECKIDSIAQSWGVISGAADKERARKAMQSVEEHLVREGEGMILLFTPPFDETEQDPGYIKGYLPGVRENGGQYTHAAIWMAIARVLMGDGDGAYRLFEMLNPINHAAGSWGNAASTKPAAPTPGSRFPKGNPLPKGNPYMVEPYVVAADIYSHPQHRGRGGWSWYTGSASWLYRLGVEYILGLKLHGGHFTVEPCIPSHWPSYSMIYRRGETSYRIRVENGAGATCQVQGIELDGSPLGDCKVPIVEDGQSHEVRVVMGSAKSPEGREEQGEERREPYP
jgi:cyclic beta-1,2-glucan synthetase